MYEIKNAIFESLVTFEAVEYKGKDGKYYGSRIVIVDEKLSKYVLKMKQYAPVNLETFIADVACEIYELILNFKHDDLRGILDRSNKKAYNALMKHLRTNIKFFAQKHYANSKHVRKTYKDVSGNTRQIDQHIQCTISSLDITLVNNDCSDNNTSLVDTVEKSYWESRNDEYKYNIFEAWYVENRERILLPSQIQFLDILQKFGYGNPEVRLGDIKQEYNINPTTIAPKIARIKKRITKYWNKERRFFEATHVEKLVSRKIALLNTFLDIKEDNDAQRLSAFIRSNCDASVIEDVLDKLTLDEYKNVVSAIQNKTDISNNVLEKLVVYVEEKVEHLQIVLLNEELMRKSLAKKENVIVPDYVEDVHLLPSTMYLKLDAYGNLHENR